MDQNTAFGLIGSLIIGLTLFGVIMGVGALTMMQVQNVSNSMFQGPTWQFCEQLNASHAPHCGESINTTAMVTTGNWSSPEHLYAGVASKTALCWNTTDTTNVCTAIIPYNVNSTAYGYGAYTALSVVINDSAKVQKTYALELPSACIHAITALNVTMNYGTATLTIRCNTTSPFTWSTIATYTNATATFTNYPAFSYASITWQLMKGVDFISGGSAATTAPIASSLGAAETAGSWTSTIAIVVIAISIIGGLVMAFRVFGGGSQGSV